MFTKRKWLFLCGLGVSRVGRVAVPGRTESIINKSSISSKAKHIKAANTSCRIPMLVRAKNRDAIRVFDLCCQS